MRLGPVAEALSGRGQRLPAQMTVNWVLCGKRPTLYPLRVVVPWRHVHLITSLIFNACRPLGTGIGVGWGVGCTGTGVWIVADTWPLRFTTKLVPLPG
jgi:hypothetical protein